MSAVIDVGRRAVRCQACGLGPGGSGRKLPLLWRLPQSKGTLDPCPAHTCPHADLQQLPSPGCEDLVLATCRAWLRPQQQPRARLVGGISQKGTELRDRKSLGLGCTGVGS